MINVKKILMVILLGILSCKQPKPESVKKDSFLVGKWENCQETYIQDDGRGMTMMRNECPFIIFDKNNIGYVKMGDVIINSVFRWSVKKDVLTISQYKNIGKPYFDLGRFELQYQNGKEIKEVVLFDTLRKVQYSLER